MFIFIQGLGEMNEFVLLLNIPALTQGTTKSRAARADKLKSHGQFFPKSCTFRPSSARKLSEKEFKTVKKHRDRLSMTDTVCP